jgi:hypothetical protein
VTISLHTATLSPFLGLDAFQNDTDKYSSGVIVTSDTLEVLSMPMSLLSELFTKNVGLHFRLSLFIARQLWVSLREFEKDGKAVLYSPYQFYMLC